MLLSVNGHLIDNLLYNQTNLQGKQALSKFFQPARLSVIYMFSIHLLCIIFPTLSKKEIISIIKCALLQLVLSQTMNCHCISYRLILRPLKKIYKNILLARLLISV